MGAGGRPAEAAARPDPEPGRDGQGLRRPRARDLRRGHRRPAPPPSRRRARRQQAQAENVLTQALGRLFAVAEAYPQLRATENFQQLQAQLSETEQNIAISRQVYNDTVLTYDNALADRADEHHRRDLQLPAARVLPDRRRRPRGAAGVASDTTAAPPAPDAAPPSRAARRQRRAASRRPEPQPTHPARPRRGGGRGARRRCPPPSRSRTPSRRRTSPCGSPRTARCSCARTSAVSSTARSAARYRDIPLRKGESIDHVSCREKTARRTGRGGRHGSSGQQRHRPAGTASSTTRTRCASSGTTRRSSEQRTFTITLPLPRARSRLRRRRRREHEGLGRRVEDVARPPLGDDGAPGRRRSGPRYRVYGHPRWVKGVTASFPDPGDAAGGQRPAAPVRRDARRLPAQPAHLDRRREGGRRARPRRRSSTRRSPTSSPTRTTRRRSTTPSTTGSAPPATCC